MENIESLTLHVLTKNGLLRPKMENDGIEVEGSEFTGSVLGEGRDILKLKFKISVSPHIKGNYRPRMVDFDDMDEFFRKVMCIKQEHMSTVNWSNRKISMRSFVCTMYLTEPDVYDKANYERVTNGRYVAFGELVQGKPRWFATFETSTDKSGVAFMVLKPLSKGLTKANKFELCAQLRKRHEICSDMYDIKHNTDNPTLAGSSTDDWLFFALFVSPDFEYPLFTSGPIPFNLNGKTVFLNIKRKENLKQLEERLKQTEKTESEIKEIIMRKKTENYINNVKAEQKLEKATVEEARTDYALKEIEKLNIVEPVLNKKEYLTIKIQQAQTKFDRARYAAKRDILLREDKKKNDKEYFQMMREVYDVENEKNSGKWKKLFTNSIRLDLVSVMRNYDEKAKEEDKKVEDHYFEFYGHLDEELEREFREYLDTNGGMPSPIGGTGRGNGRHESTKNGDLEDQTGAATASALNVPVANIVPRVNPLESAVPDPITFAIPLQPVPVIPTQPMRPRMGSLKLSSAAHGARSKFSSSLSTSSAPTNLRTELLEAEKEAERVIQNAKKRGRVISPTSEHLNNKRKNAGSSGLEETVEAVKEAAKPTLNNTGALFGERVEDFVNGNTDKNILDETSLSLSASNSGEEEVVEAVEAVENRENTLKNDVGFITKESVHTAEGGVSVLESTDAGDSPNTIAGNSKWWGNWNRRRWIYFLKAQEFDGVNCLKHDLEWHQDNIDPFLGRVFTRNNATEHLKKLFRLMSMNYAKERPLDNDEFMDFKAALYFLGPRNKGQSAHFSRENIESLDWEDLTRMPGRLVDMVAIRKTPSKVDSLVPIWIQLVTLLDGVERNKAWTTTYLYSTIARPHFGVDGVWRLISNLKYLQWQRKPNDAIGTNIVGEKPFVEKQNVDDQCFN